MAEVAAPPAPDAMQDIVSSAPTEVIAPEEPEHISETLYIQNLNEKIKIDGNRLLYNRSPIILNIYAISTQGFSAWSVQVIWRSFRCCRA